MAFEKGIATVSGITPLVAQDKTDIKTRLELQNVDNTSDLGKPISTATQSALNDKQNILTEGAFIDGDKTKLDGIEALAEVNPTAGEIKTLYESNADTNAFTDAEQSKLTGIEAGAEVNPKMYNDLGTTFISFSIDPIAVQSYKVGLTGNSTLSFGTFPAINETYVVNLICTSQNLTETLSFSDNGGEITYYFYGTYDPALRNKITIEIICTALNTYVAEVFINQPI
jgi:hypothetical protein